MSALSTEVRSGPLAAPINGWKTILNSLTIHYGDRIAAAGY